jgi:hypothetical protein
VEQLHVEHAVAQVERLERTGHHGLAALVGPGLGSRVEPAQPQRQRLVDRAQARHAVTAERAEDHFTVEDDAVGDPLLGAVDELLENERALAGPLGAVLRAQRAQLLDAVHHGCHGGGRARDGLEDRALVGQLGDVADVVDVIDHRGQRGRDARVAHPSLLEGLVAEVHRRDRVDRAGAEVPGEDTRGDHGPLVAGLHGVEPAITEPGPVQRAEHGLRTGRLVDAEHRHAVWHELQAVVVCTGAPGDDALDVMTLAGLQDVLVHAQHQHQWSGCSGHLIHRISGTAGRRARSSDDVNLLSNMSGAVTRYIH